ncbi:Gfo/Idh/MocA family oxidoreductase, partial [Mycobacterium tuberculosis]|nr:Gfo/Idh/MocA family oxidoreductase [Mycobacterium tuberculosis]
EVAMRFAVLGAGRIGKIHGGNAAAHPRATLVSVSDADAAAAGALAAATGAVVRPLDEAIVAGDIDAVLVCTPTTTHADIVERAAKA